MGDWGVFLVVAGVLFWGVVLPYLCRTEAQIASDETLGVPQGLGWLGLGAMLAVLLLGWMVVGR